MSQMTAYCSLGFSVSAETSHIESRVQDLQSDDCSLSANPNQSPPK